MNHSPATASTTTPELWAAIYAQAAAWAQAPVVREVAVELPSNVPLERRGTGANTIASLLLEIKASYGGMLRPFMLGTRLPFILGQASHLDNEVDQEKMTAWLDATMTLERAHRVTLAWFRSRLPGYPSLAAPQLARHTQYTTNEYSPRFIWTPEERGERLQFEPSPPHVPGLLGAPDTLAPVIEQAARDVVREFAHTGPWVAFHEAHHALDADARADLASAKRDLAGLLTPEAVDLHEPNLMLNRAEYRAQHTRDVISQMTGTARIYADAFTAVEDLIDLAATDVFSCLAVFGDPLSVPVSALEFSGSDRGPLVEFDASGALPMLLDDRKVVWLKDTPVTDAVLLRGYRLSFSQIDDSAHFAAQILEGTSQAWPRDH